MRDSVADPVADCRLAGQVFREQWAELARRAEGPGLGLLSLYRFCFRGATGLESAPTGGSGISLVFAALGADLPDLRAALDLLLGLWAGRVCASVARAEALGHLGDPHLRPALAYATAWLAVAGARSILPPWVRHRFPETAELIRSLREVPCGDPACAWCLEVHDPRAQLKRWFGFDAFRPLPATADGGSLQEAVVRHGMGGGSHLAILPTGGGKSLCFQLPALVRNLRRGVLTVVISPLQALMKDQVDNLARKTGTTAAVALYGMLTPPERGEVLERIRLGDAAILYVSPEQLRNASFRTRPGDPGDRLLGLRRGPLPLQVGPRLPPRLPLRRPLHPGAGRAPRGAGAAGRLLHRHRQARRDRGDPGLLPGAPGSGADPLRGRGGARQPGLRGPGGPSHGEARPGPRHPRGAPGPDGDRRGAAIVYAATRGRTEELAESPPCPGLGGGGLPRRTVRPREAPHPGRLRRRRAAGDLRHQRLRHGGGQGGRAPGRAPGHPRLPGELRPGGGPRRARP